MVILTHCDWDRYMCDLPGSKIFHCDSVDSRSRDDIEWNAFVYKQYWVLSIIVIIFDASGKFPIYL